MTKKRQILFSVIRGLLAILIALLVATLLIFLSADGDSFAEKLAATGGALKQLLVGPLFRMGRSGTKFDFKRLTDILASMIPIIFTGLSVCVMFSANQFNLGSEGGIMLGAFSTAMVAVYVPMAAARVKKDWLVPVPIMLANAVLVGAMLAYVLTPTALVQGFFINGGEVLLGEAVVLYLLGVPLLVFFRKNGVMEKLMKEKR